MSAPIESALASRLPPEIFLHICELACPWTTHRSVFNVIALTHVCRRWRDALLSYPIIWAHIYVWCNSPEPLVATVLKRSRGVPLTVNIQYYSDRTHPYGCGCSYQPTWEDEDYCPRKTPQMPSLDLLEPFRANVHMLNVRYLRDGTFDARVMEDILKTPFFLKSFPNLESLRWSCRHLDEMVPPFKLPRRLFGTSLPRLRELSMVNCWGLLLTDTPMLKVMLVECTAKVGRTGISADRLVQSLRRRQSLTTLSFINCRIIPDPESPPGPASMENLKEITIQNTDSDVVSRYIRCPSMGIVTNLRVAPFTHGVWADNWSSLITATDGLGGSVSSLVYVTNDTSLRTTWEAFATTFRHAVTTLEIEDLHLIKNGPAAIHTLIGVLPNLYTLRVRLSPVALWFRVLREMLLSNRGITRVERLVIGTEGPDEAKERDEEWEASCTEYKLQDFLT